MDARIAIITGTVFAGVLVAGALAAPRGGHDTTNAIDSAASVSPVDDTVQVVDQAPARWQDDDDNDDDHRSSGRRERDDDDDDHEGEDDD